MQNKKKQESGEGLVKGRRMNGERAEVQKSWVTEIR
jgi:hypothetical protein